MNNSSKVETCLKIIPSNGDCFYRAVVEAFKLNGDDVRNYETVFTETHDEGVISLRRTAAMGLTQVRTSGRTRRQGSRTISS